MDCPVSAQYQPALARFSGPNQQRILGYLARLAARQYADTTLSAVVTTLNVLLRHLPGRRQGVLTDDITRTTTQDITDFITLRSPPVWPPPLSIPSSVFLPASSISTKKAR